jgi:hypothetical protein
MASPHLFTWGQISFSNGSSEYPVMGKAPKVGSPTYHTGLWGPFRMVQLHLSGRLYLLWGNLPVSFLFATGTIILFTTQIFRYVRKNLVSRTWTVTWARVTLWGLHSTAIYTAKLQLPTVDKARQPKGCMRGSTQTLSGDLWTNISNDQVSHSKELSHEVQTSGGWKQQSEKKCALFFR